MRNTDVLFCMMDNSAFPSVVCLCVLTYLQQKHHTLLLLLCHLSCVSGLRIQHSQERPRRSSDAITIAHTHTSVPLSFHLMNHSVVRFRGDCPVVPAMQLATVASPRNLPLPPQSPLSFKSHLVVGSVISTIKQEALCSEQEPLWE